MHDTALATGKLFFDLYAQQSWKTIIEIGSLDVNGSLRMVAPSALTYIGVDADFGKSVDLKVPIGEPLPFRADFADAVVSSSQMEHDDFFWMTFLDMARVVKPGGYIYINAPSNGTYHRYPNDNWRFYPDCGRVLERWSNKNGVKIELVESFVSDRSTDLWNDFGAIFIKGELETPPERFVSDHHRCRNVWQWRAEKPTRENSLTEDQQIQSQQRESLEQMQAALTAHSGTHEVAELFSDPRSDDPQSVDG